MSGLQSKQSCGRRVLLFSGHMVDAPGREKPRFPPTLEAAVKRSIRVEVDGLAAGPDDVAISSAACGSDILFAEAVVDRGVALRIYLPFDEATFLDKSVNFANDRWPERYRAAIASSQRFIAPEALGPLPDDADPFERVNSWMLDEARFFGAVNIVLICVWDGLGGDGPGGTKHMIDAVRGAGGDVRWIDIREL